eukprot:scaffold12213_cov115-Isochrysis_galbana.AAC.14
MPIAELEMGEAELAQAELEIGRNCDERASGAAAGPPKKRGMEHRARRCHYVPYVDSALWQLCALAAEWF